MIDFIMSNIFIVAIAVFFVVGFLIASTENFGDFNQAYPDELFSPEEKEKLKRKWEKKGK